MGGSVPSRCVARRPRDHGRDGQAAIDHAQRGRPLVERLLLRALETGYQNGLDRDLRLGRIGPEGVRYAPALLDVIDRDGLTAALHAMWPALTPDALVRQLLSSPRRLARAGRDILTADEVDALHASSAGDDGWSEADVALLDEADLLLGPVPTRRRARGRRPRLDHVAERILEERLPDCPQCGRPLEFWPGEASGRDRLDCRECKITYATTALMGDAAANELHGVYEELAHQFDVDDAPVVRPADAQYGPCRGSTRPKTSRRCSGARSRGGVRASRSRSPVTRPRRFAPARRRHGIASSRRSASMRRR